MTALNAPEAKAQSRARQFDRLTDESGKYVVSPLSFTYDALEPVIDEKTVDLHYNFHHKAYAAAANRACRTCERALDTTIA